MGTLDLQPGGVTTPTGAGWEQSLGQAGSHKGHQTCLPKHSRKGKAGPGVPRIYTGRSGGSQGSLTSLLPLMA